MRKLKNSELNRIDVDEFKKTKKTPIVVVLDNIRSCNNIGSVFRTADALLIESIYLCGYTATPPNKDIHKTALGAEISVNWKSFKDPLAAIAELKGNNYKIYAIEQVEGSIMLPDFYPLPNEKIAVIFGNEVRGVQQKIIDACDGAIEIPQYGTKHSFNISVSAGIILWDIFNKLNHMAGLSR